jgi:hypothetical protein
MPVDDARAFLAGIEVGGSVDGIAPSGDSTGWELAKSAAERSSLTTRRITALAGAGRLGRSRRIGRTWLIDRSAVDERIRMASE